MKRTFIYTDDKSNKFWTIEIENNSYTVNYGKVGTAGQTQTKDFADETACQKAVEKVIAEKTKKGYVEQGGDTTQKAGKSTQTKSTTKVKKEEMTDDVVISEGLPSVFKICSIDVMKNGRSVGYFNYYTNWDKRTEKEDPCGIDIRDGNFFYKKMPTPELAIIDTLRMIAEKIAGGCKFDYGTAVINGKEIKFTEEQLNAWLKIATNNGKENKAFYNPQKDGDVKRYVNAIKNGDIELVKKFIDNGAKIGRIKLSSSNDFYPLLIALRANHPELVKLYLGLIDNCSVDGMYPEEYCYFSRIANEDDDNYEQQLHLLLDSGYNLKKDSTLVKNLGYMDLPADIEKQVIDAIDIKNDDGRAIYESMIHQKYNRMRMLVSRGFSVTKTPEDNKQTPLHKAIVGENTDISIIKILVENGADPNARDVWGDTPLDTATKFGQHGISNEVYQYLHSITTDYKPNIFKVLDLLNERLDIVKLLLSRNVDFNAKCESQEQRSIWNKDYSGYTPLQYAEDKKMPADVIEYLRGNTTIPKLSVEQEAAILHHYFDTLKSEPMVNNLKEALANGADPNMQNADGNTFLHRVMQSATDLWKYVLEFIDLAVKNGADVNIRNNSGVTVLMLAAKAYKPEYAAALIAAGADVNIQDNEGNTVVFYVDSSYFGCLLPILKANPDLLLKNKKGVTAIDYLRNEGLYYTDGFVYESKQEIKEAIDALGLDLPTDQQLQGVEWKSKAIDTSKTLPDEYTEASSYYFPFNDCSDELLYVGGNRLALVGGYPRIIQFFDTVKGKVIWGLNRAARMGYVIYDEERNVIYVARDGSSSANYITAHDPDTGKMVWKKECKLTNSSEQFGTFFVQNSTHLIHANIRKDVLYFVNKDTGKLDAKLNLTHGIDCGAYFTDKKEMFTHGNNLYVFGVDSKADYFTIDRYDIATQTFAQTIFKSPKGARLLGFQEEGDFVYVLANTGVMYKLALPDGKIISQIKHDPEEKETPNGYGMRYIRRKGNVLRYELKDYNRDTDGVFTFDLNTDTLTPPEKQAPVKQKEKKVKYGKKDWKTIKSLTLGDAIFEIQKKSWTSDSKSCYLHRIS